MNSYKDERKGEGERIDRKVVKTFLRCMIVGRRVWEGVLRIGENEKCFRLPVLLPVEKIRVDIDNGPPEQNKAYSNIINLSLLIIINSHAFHSQYQKNTSLLLLYSSKKHPTKNK